MFDRMRDAARQAKVEQKVRATLASAGLAEGATISIRLVDGAVKATILLAEPSALDGPAGPTPEALAALEAQLAAVDGIDDVTLVTTSHNGAHNAAPTTPHAPPPERPPEPPRAPAASGHDNPLALPGARKKTPPPGARPPRQRPGDAKRVIAVASGKGGVGKSTVAAHLAMALAATGAKVGLLDLDIYGPSLPVLFDLDGIRPPVEDGQVLPLEAAGIQLMSIGFLVTEDQSLAWRGPMVMGAAKQLLGDVRWKPLDWLIIDTPPGTGDTHLTLMQRTRIDGAVIVSTPSPLAVADVRRGAALFEKMEVPLLGLVENMAALADGTRLFGDGLSDSVLETLGLKVLLELPIDPKLVTLPGREGKPHPAFGALADQMDALISAKAG